MEQRRHRPLALCELNYTPQNADGSIDITKAVNVNEQFQVTRQFWTYAHENGILPDVRNFLNPIPHVSFVHGADPSTTCAPPARHHGAQPAVRLDGVHRRRRQFARRLPLMAAGRDFSEPVALNWTADGTDVDFGSLSRQLLRFGTERGMSTLFGHEVIDLDQESDGGWR